MSVDIEFEVPDIDPAFLGQVEEVDGEAEEFEVTELDIAAFRNHQVRITVDGEDMVVPLSEALAGYQRQADYTRKTQSLAEQRTELQWAEALKGALANDPEGTIDLISEHYGISRKAAAERVADVDPWETTSASDPKVSEVEARLARIEAREQAAIAQEADMALHAEVDRLQGKYGEDFDPREVIAAAMAAGSTDLEATFKAVAFDRIVAKQGAIAAKAAETAAATDAKRAAGVVSGGSSSKGAPDSSPIRSISDAYFASKRELGVG